MTESKTAISPSGSVAYFAYQVTTTPKYYDAVTLEHTLSDAQLQDPGRDIHLYADVIRLPESVNCQGRSLTLHARLIESIGPVRIDTSGRKKQGLYTASKAAAGTPPTLSGQNGARGEDGKAGVAGEAAGSITILAHTIRVPRLTLVAKGFDGQDGQDGGDGSVASNGKNGVDAGQFIGMTTGEPATVGEDAGHGGAGGKGGDAGVGGRGGDIALYFVNFDGQVDVEQSAGKNGTPGRGGAGGSGGNGGKGGRPWVKKTGFWDRLFTPGGMGKVVRGEPLSSGKNGQGGAGGTDGKAVPHRARDGEFTKQCIAELHHQHPIGNLVIDQWPPAKHSNLTKIAASHADDCWKQEHVWVEERTQSNLDQLQLMMGKAKRLYLSARTEGEFEELVWLLSWIYRCTPNEEDLRIRTVVKAYVDEVGDTIQEPAEIFADSSPLDVRTSNAHRNYRQLREYIVRFMAQWPELQAIHVQAGVLLTRLAEGLDFYGYQPGWAPPIREADLKSHLDVVLAAAESIEQLYKGYEEKVKSRQDIETTLNRAVAEQAKVLDENYKLLTEKANERKAIEDAYQRAALDVYQKEKELRGIGEAFLQTVRDEYGMDVLKNLVQLSASIYTVGSEGFKGLSVAQKALSAVEGKGGTEGNIKAELPASLSEPTRRRANTI